MFDRLGKVGVDLLRLPGAPEAPAGRAGSVKVFRAAPGYLRYRRLGWTLSQLGAAAGLVAGFAFVGSFETGIRAIDGLAELLRDWSSIGLLQIIEFFAFAAFVLQLLPSWLLLELDYRFRWYVITDRSLRIREGLWRIEERTMTFSNLQNVEVRQGPLQRVFGIADLQVQTAGGGGEERKSDAHSGGDPLHLGRFRGIENAEEIRDAILAKLRRLEDTGLGNPDEPAPVEHRQPGLSDASSLAAARELLRQTQRLAAELSR